MAKRLKKGQRVTADRDCLRPKGEGGYVVAGEEFVWRGDPEKMPSWMHAVEPEVEKAEAEPAQEG